MASAADEVLPRTFGRYTLLEHLGEGGMAEVLLARQEGIEGTHRLVAIKRILPSLALDEDFVEMFLDEVRIVFGLRHPNIGHILDVGECQGSYYLAMEYIQGRDFAEICRALEQSGYRVPIEMAVEVGRQVSAALHHAHTKSDGTGRKLNIVHRDITPDNIILTFDGSTKVVDFGIAIAENRLSSTRAGLLKGKPPYMAPELVLGEKVDGRADVFSLGVVLYRLITRHHPFKGSSPERIFKRIIEETPPEPAQIEPSCPRMLSDLLMRALAKEPEERFAGARHLSDALDELAVDLGHPPSPRTMATWLAGLFPRAAAARDRSLANPNDSRAAIDASYLSVSAAIHHREDDMGDSAEISDMVTRPGFTLDDKEPEESYISGLSTRAGLRSPTGGAPEDLESNEEPVLFDDEDDDPSAKTVVETAILESEPPENRFEKSPAGSSMERALEWAFEEEEKLGLGEQETDPPSRDELEPEPEGTSEEMLPPGHPVDEPDHRPTSSLDGTFELREEVWSPRQHWEHLPPRLRSLPVVSVVSLFAAALLFFAALGVHSCL